MSEVLFSWMPIYQELAGKLLSWRNRQPELIEVLRAAQAKGYAVGNLNDEDNNGRQFPLKVIDPFSFFATFNRKVRDEWRIGILEVVKAKLELASPLPSDFTGLPIMHPQKSFFFSFEREREKDAIDTLWDFAEAIISKQPESLPPDLFARCLGIRQVGLANLTMGMFWMRPDSYFALDGANCAYLKRNGIEAKVENWESYLALRKQVALRMPGLPWSELSHKAYEAKTRNTRYWLFQANPDLYDVGRALRAGALRTWHVNQQKKHIHGGDRVVIWQSGSNSGAYALATVVSEVGEVSESAEEATYWTQGAGTDKPFIGVELKVDRHFCDAPIRKEVVMKQKDMQEAPIGRQGTNFELTEKQFRAFESLAPLEGDKRRYWLYAPGPQAMYWEECQEKGFMLFGFDELGDLSQYKTQEEIQQALKKIKNMTAEPTNDALGTWEFANVVKPNDIVFAKRGRREYLGYGIVEGPYERDESRATYNNFRRVKWMKTGSWPSGDVKIAVKTLTDITEDPEYVRALQETIGITTAPGPQFRPSTILPSRNVILYGPPGTGKTYTLRKVYMEFFTDTLARRYKFTTFHQSFSYEDFIEGIKPQMKDKDDGQVAYEIRDGVFKEIAREAASNPTKQYALFIDEINRGNVASIFGELITLIEDDKRLKASNELKAVLPYSREEFGVPPNLFIIGTMNTADRSVEALDTALRRRFTFIEMRPQVELVPVPAGLKVDLRQLFLVVNARIEQLLDHDHCIGHAYFMEIKDLKDLRSVFANKIIPLLREYFYGNPAKVGMVLGERFVSRKPTKTAFAPGCGADELDEKDVYTFTDVSTLKEEDFQTIYAGASTGI